MSQRAIEHIEDIEDAAFHVLDVMDRLQIESADLVGMSLGGWMAAEVAVRWPERVRRMVLVNSVGLYVEGSRDHRDLRPEARRARDRVCSPIPSSPLRSSSG